VGCVARVQLVSCNLEKTSLKNERRRWARTVALSLASAACALGGPLMAAPTVIKRPAPDEINAVWPIAAAKAGVRGAAGMRCRVTVEGGVGECAPLIESPLGQGFGAALMTLAPKFRFSPNDAGQVVVVQASWPAWDSGPDWPGRPVLNADAFARATGPGAALVSCLVDTNGKVSDCVIADAVGDRSVARAALSATKGVRLRPALSGGQPVQSIFTIPINLGDRGSDAR